MIHLDLFSGIGLFSYAADHVWNLEHVFCEIEDWPYRFLKQEYPDARIERDIKTFNGTEYAGRTFLLTAGVPCQPASVAGKRKGTEDDRWLWPEALRVMAEAQPEWAIFENPLGILTLKKGLVFENLVLEMEGQGYAVQPYIIPAGSIGAVHRRNRVWIVANPNRGLIQDNKKEKICPGRNPAYTGNSNASNAIGSRFNGEGISIRREGQEEISLSARTNKNAPNSKQSHHRSQIISEEIKQSQTERSSSGIGGSDSNDPDTIKQGLPGASRGQIRSVPSQARTFKGRAIDGISSKERDFWQKPWPEVAIKSCIRGVDVSFTNGIYKIEKFEKGERIKRMKALGNTIQWEVAAAIMLGIKSLTRSR